MLAMAAAQETGGIERAAISSREPKEACTNSTHSMRQLAVIDHTSDGGFQCIGVYVQGDTVTAIRLERHVFAAVEGHKEAEHIKIVEYPRSIVDSPRGAVIDGVPGHDAIVLHGHLAAPTGDGDLVISYLFNGITGEYHSCRIVLDRSDAGWRLVNQYDRPFSMIMVRLRQIPVIGVVGIDNLEGACT